MRRSLHVASLLTYILQAILLSSTAAAQSRDLLGTWKLISVKSTTINGEMNPAAFGQNPTGFATFTREGRLSLIMVNDGRKPLSILDRDAAPADERAQAFSTFVAYAGRYSFTGEKVVFHIEASSIQNWVNTDLTRTVTFHGEQVSLRTMTTMKGGVAQTIETTWQRLK